MRVKESWTIDDDLSKWVRNQNEIGASEFVNRILRDAMHAENNLYSKLDDINREIAELEESKKGVMKELEVIFEEGDKQAREEAEKKLIEEKSKEEIKKQKLEEKTLKIMEAGYFDALLKCKTTKDIYSLSKKMKQDKFILDKDIPEFKRVYGLGIEDLKQLLEYHGKSVLDNFSDLEELKPKVEIKKKEMIVQLPPELEVAA